MVRRKDGAAAAERRIDPSDGVAYTLAEMSQFYAGVYTKAEIKSYWGHCKAAAEPKAKAKAKVKAKAKSTNKSVAKLIARYELEPLPDEGGFFRRTFLSDITVVAPYASDRSAGNAIYYLMTEDDFSRFHRLKGDEMWHFYEGGAAHIIELDSAEEGHARITVLGRGPGRTLQHAVRAGTWFAARPLEGQGYSLVGCTPTPAFDVRDFEMGKAEELLRHFPDAANWIKLLSAELPEKEESPSGAAPGEVARHAAAPAQGSVALVTGASSGLGAAIAAALASPRLGLRVAAGLRDPGRLGGLHDALDAAGVARDAVTVVPLDVCDDASVEGAVALVEERLGKVSVLVNNAGVLVVGTAEMVSISQARDIFETNFLGAMRTMQRCLPAMREAGTGCVVNISSIFGEVPTMNQPVYAASKAALDELSLASAGALAPMGVRVHTVQPGGIKDTAIGANLRNGDRFQGATNPYPIDEMVAESVFKRVIPNAQTSAEVAAVVSDVVEGKILDAQVQTSNWCRGLANLKLRDASGSAMVALGY